MKCIDLLTLSLTETVNIQSSLYVVSFFTSQDVAYVESICDRIKSACTHYGHEDVQYMYLNAYLFFTIDAFYNHLNFSLQRGHPVIKPANTFIRHNVDIMFYIVL